MTKRLLHLLRSYPLTLFCVTTVWYLSLFRPPSTSLSDIEGFDKWVHMLMYAGLCSLLWYEHLRHHREPRAWRRFLPFGLLAPLCMSGLLELLQEYCTTTRSGEWADLCANSAGIVIAALAAGYYSFRQNHRQS